MASPKNVYVNGSTGSNANGGTSDADAYETLEYALNNMTHDGTNGTQVNVCDSAVQNITVALSTNSVASGFADPLIIRGYTTTANDGGRAVLDGGGGAYRIVHIDNTSGVHLIDLEIRDCTAAEAVWVDNSYCSMLRCYVHDCSNDGVKWEGARSYGISSCEFYDIAGDQLVADSSGMVIRDCFFRSDSGNEADCCLHMDGGHKVERCYFDIDGATDAIQLDGGAIEGAHIANCSILSDGGTGIGIHAFSGSCIGTGVVNNLVEGFSGSGGKGIEFSAATSRQQTIISNNSAYNCDTDFDLTDEIVVEGGSNESLGSSPFAKSGSATFANRLTYFANNDVGDVREGSWLTGNLDRGAVQHHGGGGGGSTVIVIED